MRVLPVIDLMGGQVVRGVGGRRQEYRPIVSALAARPEPLAVANAFHDAFGLEKLYVADLDAIAGREPAWAIYEGLMAAGFQLWVDAGLGAGTAERLAEIGVESVLAGLESLAGAAALAKLVEATGAERLVFSLDMKAGQALGNPEGWGGHDPESIAQEAVDAGVRRMLLLDLASVGEGQGTPTARMCRRLGSLYPELEIATGGGVRNANDLWNLMRSGVKYALVASALHDGAVTRAEIEELHGKV